MIIYNKYINEFEGFYLAGCSVEEVNKRCGTNFITFKDSFPDMNFKVSAKRDEILDAMRRVREIAIAFRATGLVEYNHDYGWRGDPIEATGTPIWEPEELNQLILDGELLTQVKQGLAENQSLSENLKSMLTT